MKNNISATKIQNLLEKNAEKHCDSNLFYYLCNCKGERNWGLVDLIGILIK